MTFEVAAEAYDRFMGRYSQQLSPQLADFAGIRAGRRVLDVGCGPGALTAELVRRVGEDQVSAVDPSDTFVAAARARYPGVDVQSASAERLREMKRVASPGGTVAASVWDHVGERTPIAVFWQAARELDPDARDESGLAGGREGHLGEVFADAGLASVEETSHEASVRFESFDEWWEPFTLGVGPAGAYAQTRDEASLQQLRARCEELLPAAPFTLSAWAWAARGVA
jgi:SAM-dependent methyltransferase